VNPSPTRTHPVSYPAPDTTAGPMFPSVFPHPVQRSVSYLAYCSVSGPVVLCTQCPAICGACSSFSHLWSDARAAWNFRISRARRVNKTEDLFLRDHYLIPCKPYPNGLPFHIIMRCHITVGYRVPIGDRIDMRSHVGACCPCTPPSSSSLHGWACRYRGEVFHNEIR